MRAHISPLMMPNPPCSMARYSAEEPSTLMHTVQTLRRWLARALNTNIKALKRKLNHVFIPGRWWLYRVTGGIMTNSSEKARCEVYR